MSTAVLTTIRRRHLPIAAGTVVDPLSVTAAVIETAALADVDPEPLAHLLVRWGLGGTLTTGQVTDLVRDAAEKLRLADQVIDGRIGVVNAFDGADRMPDAEARAVAADLWTEDAALTVRTLATSRHDR